MTKKEYLTHIIKNVLHTTNVKKNLESNDEKGFRFQDLDIVSQITSKYTNKIKLQLNKKFQDFSSR